MAESNTKKVLTWLQGAVERVREFAYTEPPVPAPTPGRPRIGVALGGGFARGIAHLGVLRVLEEENIPVDYLTGTSAGALLAISYASGHTIPEIERQARPLDSRISAAGSFPGWASPRTKSWSTTRENFWA